MISPDPTTPPGHPEQNVSTTRAKLANDKGTVNWEYLRPHYQRKALLFVDPSLELEEVGAAFSHDEGVKVKDWLKGGDLVQVADLHAAHWEMEETLEFEALVVSPFVLCRPARA